MLVEGAGIREVKQLAQDLMTSEQGSEGFNSGRPAPAVHSKPLEHTCFPILSLLFLTLEMSPGSFMTSTAAPAIFTGSLPDLPSGPLSGFCFIEKEFATNPVWPYPEVTHL